MKFGVALGRLNPAFHLEATLEAERLGYESVWLPEHLVFPRDLSGSPFAGAEHPPVPPETPVFDAFAYLSFLAGRTTRIRLGTHVYLLALRHPFVAARAVQTLDVVSGGRAEVGVGAGWLGTEWPWPGRRTPMKVARRDMGDELLLALGVGPELMHMQDQQPWPEELQGIKDRIAHTDENLQIGGRRIYNLGEAKWKTASLEKFPVTFCSCALSSKHFCWWAEPSSDSARVDAFESEVREVPLSVCSSALSSKRFC